MSSFEEILKQAGSASVGAAAGYSGGFLANLVR